MPRVKPLGTQPDQRPERFAELVGAGMVRKKITSRAELSRQTGINYDTLSERLEYPSSFKLSEMLKVADVLEIPADEFERVFRKGGK